MSAAKILEQVRAERARVSAVISEACARLNGLDPGDDGYVVKARAYDEEIREHQQALSSLARQIAGLEDKVAAEELVASQAGLDVAVKKAHALRSKWPAALQAYADALAAKDAAKAAMSEIARQIARAWPDILERPIAHDFDVDRLCRVLDAASPDERLEVVALVCGRMADEVEQPKQQPAEKGQAA